MNPERWRFRAFLAFPSADGWVCVEREEGEESLERRRNWDHARHGERVKLDRQPCIDHALPP